MWAMPSPYANPYGDLTTVNVKGPSPEERRKAQGAGASADLLRLLGAAAPVAGGLIGAGVGSAVPGIGTMLGGAVGSGIGGLVGAGANYGAEQAVRPYEEADLARRRRLDAINRVLGSL